LPVAERAREPVNEEGSAEEEGVLVVALRTYQSTVVQYR